MGTTKWEVPASPETILTTELNALGIGANKISGVISNDQSGELYLYADIELYVNSTAARGDDARVELYLLGLVAGGSYAYGGDALDPAPNTHVGDFQLDAGATTARMAVLRNILLPPEDFKLLVTNELGVAMASVNNTLKIIRYNIQT